MVDQRVTGLRRLGWFPLALPALIAAAIFVVATQYFALPVPGWAVLTLAFGALCYLLLWLGMRQVDALEAGEIPRTARLPVSPGGVLASGFGVWALLRGDLWTAVPLLAVGSTAIALRWAWARRRRA